MDLTLSDEQRLLRESADRFVNETYTADHRRRIANDPLGFTGLSMLYQRAGRIADAEAAANQARVLEWKQQLAKP